MQIGDDSKGVALFEQQPVRRAWYDGRWFYSVIDVVAVLVENDNPRRYWSDLKRKLKTQGFDEVYEKIVQLALMAPDGKMRETDCADMETVLRIIQSVPSPKAEPFKRWLAQVGADVLDDRTEDQRRIDYRADAIEAKKRLHEEAHGRGVRTRKAHAEMEARGHEALYGGETLDETRERKGIGSQSDLGEWMSSEEIIDNSFRDAQSRAFIKRMDVVGKEPVIKAHEDVSEAVRHFIIEKLGGTPPEELPTPDKSLSEVRADEDRRRTKGMDLWEQLPPASTAE